MFPVERVEMKDVRLTVARDEVETTRDADALLIKIDCEDFLLHVVGAPLRLLFHRLNNQLGIILAHAELLEAKAVDEGSRARAAQLVTSALDAMGTAKSIRQLTEPGLAGS